MKSVILRLFSVVVCVLVMSVPAHAQGWGIRGGANVHPDQVFFGGSYQLQPFAADLWLEPNGDIGLGNDVKLLAANIDLMYRLWEPRRSPWHLDVGGGPALNHYRFGSYSETDAGMNAVAALRHSSGWGSEFRVGFLDSPDFRVGVTYKLHRRAATRPRR